MIPVLLIESLLEHSEQALLSFGSLLVLQNHFWSRASSLDFHSLSLLERLLMSWLMVLSWRFLLLLKTFAFWYCILQSIFYAASPHLV